MVDMQATDIHWRSDGPLCPKINIARASRDGWKISRKQGSADFLPYPRKVIVFEQIVQNNELQRQKIPRLKQTNTVG